MKLVLVCISMLTAGTVSALDFTAPIEKLAANFQFTEGPLWGAAKNELLFSDIPANRIVRFKDGKFETFRAPSNHSNGLTFDKQGRLIACEHGTRRVIRTEVDGTLTVLAERFEGKRLNSPNDVVVKSDGAVYFTDPPFAVRREERELDFQGVFRLAPDGKTLMAVAQDFIKPNGLAFTPDEKTLYINDTERGHIRAFEVAADGTLDHGRVFAQAPGADGMKVDTEGNVYCACKPGVMVFDRTGQLLHTYALRDQPTNLAFGDTDGQTLYITARPSLYRVRLAVPGVKVP
jgi:gluconolactonase